MVPAPFAVVATIAGLFDRFSWFPAGREQLEDLVKGNVCDSSEIFKKYQIDPIPFNIKNLSYLNTKGQ
jgi:NADH dehydrogenase